MMPKYPTFFNTPNNSPAFGTGNTGMSSSRPVARPGILGEGTFGNRGMGGLGGLGGFPSYGPGRFPPHLMALMGGGNDARWPGAGIGSPTGVGTARAVNFSPAAPSMTPQLPAQRMGMLGQGFNPLRRR